jgi:uncharacterized membrane protein YcaP (DUF421 family)
MDIYNYIFSDDKELDSLQMVIRAVIVFFISVFFLRISGRRSFGLKMPLDVVITILLGGMMGRAIVGASPFFPSLAASATLVVLHRVCGMLGVVSQSFSTLVKGVEKIVFENGSFSRRNMFRCMVSEADILEEVRQATHSESMDKIEKIFVERDGEITVITRKNT